MHVDIRWKGLQKSQALTDHVHHRLRFALHGFEAGIRSLTVRFEDLNGPRGGIDKRCSVEAVGAFGTIVAEARHSDLLAAVDLALGRAERAIARMTKRPRRGRERLAEQPMAASTSA